MAIDCGFFELIDQTYYQSVVASRSYHGSFFCERSEITVELMPAKFTG